MIQRKFIYHKAFHHKGQPTVILAKTVKGYGLGEAGEGKNISHQQKKMNEKELREFRNRLNVPIEDEDVVGNSFFRPTKKSLEYKYLLDRESLNGFLPERKRRICTLKFPKNYDKHLEGSGDRELSTTMALLLFNEIAWR